MRRMAAGMTDTSPGEVAGAVDRARRDFAELCSRADPATPVLDGHWTVHQVAAHLASVSQRYVDIAEHGRYRRGATPRDVDRINDEEAAEFAGWPLPDLLDKLEADAPTLRRLGEQMVAAGGRAPFHGGAAVDGIAGMTNWLGELRIHGHDVAAASGQPWPLPERDLLLVLTGLQQIVPAYLDPARAAGRDVMVELRVPTARPWVVHVHDDAVESRERCPTDRPHGVIRARASVLTLMLYQRIGLVGAARRGLVVAGGTRPWRVLALPTLFQRP